MRADGVGQRCRQAAFRTQASTGQIAVGASGGAEVRVGVRLRQGLRQQQCRQQRQYARPPPAKCIQRLASIGAPICPQRPASLVAGRAATKGRVQRLLV
jgi:hypothetical protein